MVLPMRERLLACAPTCASLSNSVDDGMATGMGQYCNDLLDHRLGNDHERHGDENRFQFY